MAFDVALTQMEQYKRRQVATGLLADCARKKGRVLIESGHNVVDTGRHCSSREAIRWLTQVLQPSVRAVVELRRRPAYTARSQLRLARSFRRGAIRLLD